MICWSCEKNAGGGALCASCGAVQPADPRLDHFAVLGAPRTYALDTAAVERRYKELARPVHPDRHAKSDPQARRAALSRSVQLNDAWKTLRDPVRRAEYLLRLAGIEVGGEDGTKRIAGSGATEKVPVPQELLLEVMELREALMEARVAGDDAAVAALAADVRSRRADALDEVASGFAQGPAAFGDVTGALVSVRYYDRFLDEVAAHEDARLDGGGAGAFHGG